MGILAASLILLSLVVICALCLKLRKLSAALRKEQGFRITFDHAAIPLAHIEIDGCFVRVNRELCDLLGYSSNVLLNHCFTTFIHPDYKSTGRAFVKLLASGPDSRFASEHCLIDREGRLIWAQVAVSPVFDGGNSPTYFVIAIRDITEQRESEMRLRESASRLQKRDAQVALIFQKGEIGEYTWQVGTDEVVVSPLIQRFYELPHGVETVPANCFRERQHPDDREMIEAAVRESLEVTSRIDLEFRLQLPSGAVRWLSCRGTVIRDASGNPFQVHGLNFDVTERKEAEARTRDTEQNFRLITEVIPQILWFADSEGNLEFFNERWYQYTGHAPGSGLSWGWQSAIHPEDLQRCLELWRHSLATGDSYEVEFRLMAADGSYRWHLGRALPLLDEAGKIVRWFGSCTDIDAIKNAEEQIRHFNQQLEAKVSERTTALLEAQTRLQSVLDSATEVAILALDEQGTIQLFNKGAEQMLQYSAEELIGRHTPCFLQSNQEKRRRAAELSASLRIDVPVEDIFAARYLPAAPYIRETTYVRRDGTVLDISVAACPMFDAHGNRVGTLGISSDISARKRLDRELENLNRQLLAKSKQAEQANRAKSEFLAAMSHEIRTPMNAILGMADLLWETELQPVQRDYVERFRRAGTNLLALINDILDLSKIESGHFELECVEFDVAEVLTRTVEIFLSKAEKKNIELVVLTAPDTPEALIGDPVRLQQVFLNLVGNAIKFTDSGRVSMEVSQHPTGAHGHLVFHVRDTGIGIPKNKLDVIFDDFTQAESSITRRFGGTGLGLAIARRLVKRMGGELTVDSTVGVGTTFTFDARFEPSPKPGDNDLLAGMDEIRGRRVLVIDNDATNRLIFVETCASWGMITASAASTADALELLQQAKRQQTPFSVLLLDSVMPDLDGWSSVPLIREITPDTPIIMTTSDSRPGDATRAKSLGLLAHSVKPIRRAELLRLILAANATTRTQSRRCERPADIDDLAALRILVAEDSEDNRFLLQHYLKNTPHHLTFAADGLEALQRYQRSPFDLVLMDIQMPVMDGLAATFAIRAYEKENGKSATPILALTANARSEDADRSRAAGCNGHISKPVSRATILQAIETWGSPMQVAIQ